MWTVSGDIEHDRVDRRGFITCIDGFGQSTVRDIAKAVARMLIRVDYEGLLAKGRERNTYQSKRSEKGATA